MTAKKASTKARTDDIENKTNEAVVRGKWQEHLIYHNYMFKVVDDTLAIKIIHRRPKKIPVKGLGDRNAALFVWHVRNRNHLLEGDDLNKGNESYHGQMASEDAGEAADHDERPFCSVEKRTFWFVNRGPLSTVLYQRREKKKRKEGCQHQKQDPRKIGNVR